MWTKETPALWRGVIMWYEKLTRGSNIFPMVEVCWRDFWDGSINTTQYLYFQWIIACNLIPFSFSCIQICSVNEAILQHPLKVLDRAAIRVVLDVWTSEKHGHGQMIFDWRTVFFFEAPTAERAEELCLEVRSILVWTLKNILYSSQSTCKHLVNIRKPFTTRVFCIEKAELWTIRKKQKDYINNPKATWQRICGTCGTCTQLSTRCHRLQANGYRSLHLVAERDGQPFEAETKNLRSQKSKASLNRCDSKHGAAFGLTDWQLFCSNSVHFRTASDCWSNGCLFTKRVAFGCARASWIRLRFEMIWISGCQQLQRLFASSNAEFDLDVCQICKVHSDHSVGLRFYGVGGLCNYMFGKLQQARLESGWTNFRGLLQMPGWVKWAVHVLHQRSMCKSHWLLDSLLGWRMALHSNRRREKNIFYVTCSDIWRIWSVFVWRPRALS